MHEPKQAGNQAVAAITDAGGAVVERYDYSAYGEVSRTTADGLTVLPESSVGIPTPLPGGVWMWKAASITTAPATTTR